MTRMCGVHRNARPTQKSTDVSAGDIRWCGRYPLSLSFYAPLFLSLSIRQETREEIIIRALSEMHFIRAARSRDDTRVNTQEGMF